MGVGGGGGRKVTEKGSVQEGTGGLTRKRWNLKVSRSKKRREGRGRSLREEFSQDQSVSGEAGDTALQRCDAVGLASLPALALCLLPRPGSMKV